ncbi:MAG: hypothetical protein WC966_09710 [Bradymonadales bacterium]|jgi:hypothetical protein
MRLSIKILFASIMLLLLSPVLASAQELKTFESTSYSIVPPSEWFVVSGDIAEKDRMKLPPAVREHYNPRALDAMFMDVKDLAGEKQDFKDNLNIVVVNEAVPVTEAVKKEMVTVLQQQFESMFEDFTMLSSDIVSVGKYPAFLISAKYSLLNYQIKMVQWLVPSKTESLVLTCTFDQSREEATLRLCNEAVNSLVLK